MVPTDISTAVHRALAYIARCQASNGSFAALTNDGLPASYQQVLEVHAYALDLLLELPYAEALPITGALADFLQQQLAASDLVPHYHAFDTRILFHLLAVLHAHDNRRVSASMLAAAVHVLLNLESQPGGPYHNASNPTATPEIATNIIIGRFLYAIGGPFTKLNDFIAHNYQPDTTSQHYATPWPLRWHLSHYARQAGIEPHKIPLPPVIAPGAILGAQHADGSWNIPYILGSPPQSYGSAVLGSLLAIHQLAPPHDRSHATRVLGNHPDYSTTLAIVERSIQAIEPALQANLHAAITRITGADHTYEIRAFAASVAPAIAGFTPAALGVAQLDAANIYNWTAYTLYDKILDNQSDARTLPAANVALRAAVQLFCTAVPHDTFAAQVQQIYNTIDAANNWEATYCRCPASVRYITIPDTLPNYGNYQQLAYRSKSHFLPLLGVLYLAGHTTQDTDHANTEQAFMQYLTVRQLSDDLHDWQEDLRAGHLSPVVCRLLLDGSVPAGKTSLHTLIPQLEQVFWNTTLASVCHDMQARITQAYTYLKNASSIAANSFLHERLQAYATMADHSLSEYRSSHEFVQAYIKM